MRRGVVREMKMPLFRSICDSLAVNDGWSSEESCLGVECITY